eukprot:4415783-Pyramimonas_sp.AAC.1
MHVRRVVRRRPTSRNLSAMGAKSYTEGGGASRPVWARPTHHSARTLGFRTRTCRSAKEKEDGQKGETT